METVGYVTTVVVLIFLCGVAYATVASWFEGKKKPPKLAGTAIPETGEGLDISKRYDIVYSGGDYGSQFVERLSGVRIVGYVGRDSDESVSKAFMRGAVAGGRVRGRPARVPDAARDRVTSRVRTHDRTNKFAL